MPAVFEVARVTLKYKLLASPSVVLLWVRIRPLMDVAPDRQRYSSEEHTVNCAAW